MIVLEIITGQDTRDHCEGTIHTLKYRIVQYSKKSRIYRIEDKMDNIYYNYIGLLFMIQYFSDFLGRKETQESFA